MCGGRKSSVQLRIKAMGEGGLKAAESGENRKRKRQCLTSLMIREDGEVIM